MELDLNDYGDDFMIMIMKKTSYDAVYDQPYISVPKTSKFESGPKMVKKGSKHPMLSLSMTNNVISYKNIARIAKAASHKLPGNSSLNVKLSCPVPSYLSCPACLALILHCVVCKLDLTRCLTSKECQPGSAYSVQQAPYP